VSKLHFIGGEKGGVGKSMVARILAQYFIDHGMPFSGHDSDKSHGALLRFYAGYASPVVIDDYGNLDRVVEAAAANPPQRILVDLAAQTHHALARWMADATMQKIDARDTSFRAAIQPADAGGASLGLLERQRVKVWLGRVYEQIGNLDV